MELNINQAFKYLFAEKNWQKKYFILLGVFILIGIPILNLITGIPALLYCGGLFCCLTNSRLLKPEIGIPDFKFKKLAITGLKFYSFNVLIGIFTMPLYVLLNLHAQSNDLKIIIALISFIVFIAIAIYFDIATLIFSTNLKFKSFFNYKAIKFVLIDNFEKYFHYFIIKILASIILIMGSVLTLGILAPMLYFFFADLNAQFLRQVFKIKTKSLQA